MVASVSILYVYSDIIVAKEVTIPLFIPSNQTITKGKLCSHSFFNLKEFL